MRRHLVFRAPGLEELHELPVRGVADGFALRHRLQVGTIVGDSALAVRWWHQAAGGGGSLGQIEESFVRRIQTLPEATRQLLLVAAAEPIGVSFSGGIDSGAVLLLTYHAMLRLGLSPARLKASLSMPFSASMSAICSRSTAPKST